MKCPKCNSNLKKVQVSVEGAKNKALSYQCSKCDYFEFEPESSKKVVEELRETPLKIKQKIIKLSQDRLGIYLNNNVVRSLNIKKGENIYVSVPDKKHIVLELTTWFMIIFLKKSVLNFNFRKFTFVHRNFYWIYLNVLSLVFLKKTTITFIYYLLYNS